MFTASTQTEVPAKMEDSMRLKRLTQGTLHSLQKLEDMTHDALDEQESIAKQQRQLAILHKSLQQLTQQQDRLMYKLQHGPSKVLSELLKDEDAAIEVTSEAQHAAVISSIAYAKRLKTLEFIQAYRLSGVTVTRVNDRRIRLRWDTFHQGEYHEAYYMELELKGHMQVYRYTVPHFLPVTNIAEAYLNEDLTYFVDEIGDLLNAYVSRRQQLVQLKQSHFPSIVGDVRCSQSLDYIQLYVLYNNSCKVHIHLYYDHLHATRPTRVCVFEMPGGGMGSDSSKLKQLELALKKFELPQAVSSTICAQH